ncbi:MAG: DNA polymerase III subunit alpha, partial [Oscillospiraceae bacterium]|nr:DNA polymerase III subunit alpha [Oscillospiraceae bacterium]
SSGMTGVCLGLKPENIEDITAIIALYRPGPMESIPRFIACKHDPKLITYKHPALKPILDITYGCIVYQEQVIKIFQELGGFSLGQADMVRRAISKKKAEQIKKERQAFVYGDESRGICGCIANGIPEATANAIYDEIYDFANYAFNKAHAVSYAVVAYQTAWFKCHHVREYMAALLTSVLDNTDKVTEYIAECKNCGIELLPPDINRSDDRFTVEGGGIRFGLVAIKNIGRGFVQAIMRKRQEEGDFVSFQDFCSKMIDCTEMNRRAVENLIRAGAFDSLGARRSQLMEVYQRVLDAVASQRKSNVDGQMDFFGMAAGSRGGGSMIPLPDIPEFTADQLVFMEKETTGLFISGHPMVNYRHKAKAIGAAPIREILEDFSGEGGPRKFRDGQDITIAGIVTASKTQTTKKQTLMAYVTVEDETGAMEVICFDRSIGLYGGSMTVNTAVAVQGRLSIRDEKPPQIMCNTFLTIDTAFAAFQEAQRSMPRKPMQRTVYLKVPGLESREFAHLK